MKRILWLPFVFFLIALNGTAQARPAQDQSHSSNQGGDPIASAAFEANVKKCDELRRKACEAVRKGDLATAVPILKQTIQDSIVVEDRDRVMLADIYSLWNRPGDASQAMQPMFDPARRGSSSVKGDVVTRMKYVLALLDTGKWEEAARLYEQSVTEPLKWWVPADGMSFGLAPHTLPMPHFTPDIIDGPGLRAQAHLILGTRTPSYGGFYQLRGEELPNLLEHLQQAVKADRRCLDAQFLSAVLLAKQDRFAEARTAFAQAAKLAPREAQPEIAAAVDKMSRYEENKKAFAAQKAAREARSQAKDKSGL